MDAREKRKLLEKVLKKMREELVLVEGKKDVQALQEAGVGGQVIAVNSRKPEQVVALAPAGKQALLLFDFDEEGRRKAKEFEELLSTRGVAVDRQGRKAFRALFRLRTLEEFPHALQEVENEIG